MTIADFLKELNDTAKERIKNPVMGAFICSFLVCNWQAFFILFFSDMSIEERIEFMNTKWKVLLPIIISIGYTLLIPLIMIGLDYALMPMKRKRISNIYKNKSFTTDQKIKLASKELALKNAENGNKTLEEMENKMKELTESHDKIRETDRLTIENLKDSLADSNNLVQQLNNVQVQERKERDPLQLYSEKINGENILFSPETLLGMSYIDKDGFVVEGNKGRINFLSNIGIVEQTSKGHRLTDKGSKLHKKLITNNS